MILSGCSGLRRGARLGRGICLRRRGNFDKEGFCFVDVFADFDITWIGDQEEGEPEACQDKSGEDECQIGFE